MLFSFSIACLRHVFPAYPFRIGCGDVHGHFLDEVLERLGPRHEVGFAVHFNEHADLAAHMDVAADEPLRRRAARPLGRLRQSALAQQRRRFFHVAVRFGERGLALHHPRASLVPELLYLICRDCCHVVISHS